MKKIFSKELVIGALVLVALCIIVFGIDYLKGINVFQPTNYYYASYTNVEGLAKSAPVTINGFKVGQVRDITYDYEKPGTIIVELALDNDIKLPSDTRALMTTDMLGTSTIALALGNSSTYYKPGEAIKSEQAKGLMGAVTEDILPSVGEIIPKVDTLLTNVNTLVGDPALLASIHRLDAITASLEASATQLNRTVAALPAIAGDVKHITGNFATTSDNLNEFSANVKELPVDSLMAQIQATADNLNKLSKELNNPNSTLGKLTGDPALYNNLNSTVQSLDSLFTDIKKNPKRYINVKIF